MEDFDLIVIGAGPGGYIAAIRAAQLGLKTACIEKEFLGGTCLNVGCIPSKALLQTTEHYSWIKHQSEIQGITCKGVNLDFSKMMSRKQEVVQSLVNGVDYLFKLYKVKSIKGAASFIDPHTVEIKNKDEKHTLSGKHFIIATGSEPIPLPFLPFDEKVVVSSTGALSLNDVPKKMVVVGGGVIGVELASVYNRLGTEITVVEMLDRICPAMEEIVSKNLQQALTKQGLNFMLSAKVVQAQQKKGKIAVNVEHQGQNVNLETNIVLVAIGRKAYIEGLNLDKIGLQLDKRLIKVNSHFQTSIPHIYAIGDVIEGPMLAHKASEEGYTVAEMIAGHASSIDYLTIPNVIYTHPEVAAVGLTEQEARQTGLPVTIGKAFFKANGRARCNADTDGFVIVIALGPKKNIAGVHMIGPQASELINIGAVAIRKRMTLQELATLPIAHPTLSEILKEACQHALH